MSRTAELAQLESDLAAGNVSAEVAQKRAGQLVNAFRSDYSAKLRASTVWRKARTMVARKRKRA